MSSRAAPGSQIQFAKALLGEQTQDEAPRSVRVLGGQLGQLAVSGRWTKGLLLARVPRTCVCGPRVAARRCQDITWITWCWYLCPGPVPSLIGPVQAQRAAALALPSPR